MRKSLIASAAAASAFAFVLIAPGNAGAVTTPLTFAVGGGFLTIDAPTAVQTLTVSGLQAQGTVSGVKVTDERRLLLGGWSAKAAVSIPFTNGSTDIAASSVSYLTALTGSTGVVVPVPALLPQTIETAKTVMAATGVTGVSTVTWSGTITVTLPSDVTAGTYNGEITHSVA